MKPWPMSADFIHFVDSVESDEFGLFLRALEEADVVAMDAEWKPIRSGKKETAFPRVSVMQLVCRRATCRSDSDDVNAAENDEEGSFSGHLNGSEEQASAGKTYFLSQGASHPVMDMDGAVGTVIHGAHRKLAYGQMVIDHSLFRLRKQEELIFLLDMMLIPVTQFWEAMKKMLISPIILKLGFNFKQDLLNLSKSFSGPDFHSCFDKVYPYVDIGKMFLELCDWDTNESNRVSLASICEQVVGYTLCKDLQCSNWEQRPLSAEQQVYAAADAHCLLVLYDVLKSKGLAGERHNGDVSKAIPGEGIGSILHELSTPGFANTNKDVLHARNGVAAFMVKSAVNMGLLPIDDLPTHAFSASYSYVIQHFGERLLVSEEMEKKSYKKRTKQARQSRYMHHRRDSGLLGPPPWDSSYGGDGIPKFICDTMVEGLAKQLRNVGFDTLCFHSKSDSRQMVDLAEKEGRVLLTQDVKLMRKGFVPLNYAYLIKSNGKQEQLAEVVKNFNLEILEDNLLSRCSKCNGNFFPHTLTPEEALATLSEGQTLPSYAIEERVLFWQCSQCMHLYWQGKQFYKALENFQAFARRVQTFQ